MALGTVQGVYTLNNPHKAHDLAIAYVSMINKDKKITEEEFHKQYLEALEKFKDLVAR